MRGVVALVLATGFACSSKMEPGAAPDAGHDAAAGSDAAVADAAVADAAVDAAGCGMGDNGNVHAAWALPDPTTMGRPASQGYDTSSADVAVDRVTGLTWQRATAPGTYAWAEAQAYCACLELGGHDDWRLPTRIELVTIVDFTRSVPAIDGAAFPGTPSEWFWSSSRLADDAGFAWYIYFESGFTNFIELETKYRVRCVRSPPVTTTPERYMVGAETVRDLRTGLEWQRGFDEGMRPWEDAKAYCTALTIAGGGWRLPSMKELQSLVDDTRASPSIDPAAFPDTPGEPFWSITPVLGTPGSAWRVSFEHGYTYDAAATYEYHARCVRAL
jgi:hypothetical protein